ncbi:MAG: 4Fe-4S binding protein [Acidobacteria bacterium]|nr:4Fe-4S binding protein [Acidobacteriota bacterium]
MAPEDVFRRLQQHLDRMPVGFPATKSGVEIRILQRLFTVEEAGIALELSAVPEPVPVIHRRLRRAMPREALARALDRMAERGLIERVGGKRAPKYGKSLLAVGMYERQLTRLTPELQRDLDDYMAEAFGRAFHGGGIPQLRTVPVNQAIAPPLSVGTYDDIRSFVAAFDGPFAVMDCICRNGHDLLNEPCRQTTARQTCLTFGPAARAMVREGAAHYIDREGVLSVLDEADREGLVLQPQNTQSPLFICCCCGCCCGVLKSARQLPEPARHFSTNHLADVNPDICEACGTCQGRCQMDAVSFETGAAAVLEARCIGCGLCVTTCPSGAMTLVRRPGNRTPPADTPALYTAIFIERFGKFGAAVAAGRHLLGMKV